MLNPIYDYVINCEFYIRQSSTYHCFRRSFTLILWGQKHLLILGRFIKQEYERMKLYCNKYGKLLYIRQLIISNERVLLKEGRTNKSWRNYITLNWVKCWNEVPTTRNLPTWHQPIRKIQKRPHYKKVFF